MRRVHVLRFDASLEEAAGLMRLGRSVGRRIGWLVWGPGSAAGDVPGLEAVGGMGAFRGVRVEKGQVTSVKPRSGAPVWRDVLREFFRGAAAVLVRVEAEEELPEELRTAPRLVVDGDGWRVELEEGRRLRFSTEELVGRLGRPRAFGEAAED